MIVSLVQLKNIYSQPPLHYTFSVIDGAPFKTAFPEKEYRIEYIKRNFCQTGKRVLKMFFIGIRKRCTTKQSEKTRQVD